MSDSTRINELRKEIESLCDNCNRPDKEQLGKIILSSMALGFSVGLEAPSADRPSGTYTNSESDVEWYTTEATCNLYGEPWMGARNFCPNCGMRMKGASNE